MEGIFPKRNFRDSEGKNSSLKIIRELVARVRFPSSGRYVILLLSQTIFRLATPGRMSYLRDIVYRARCKRDVKLSNAEGRYPRNDVTRAFARVADAQDRNFPFQKQRSTE